MSRPHLADLRLDLSAHNAATVVEGGWRDGRVVCRPRRPYVAIVGAGMGKEEAPLRDPDWEVWGLNVVPVEESRGVLRCDRWFELHEMHAQSERDLRWIEACPVPLYLPPSVFSPDGRVVTSRWDETGYAYLHNPRAVAYPLARVEAAFGGYWACTFAYQIALALLEGFERIGLYGVELAYGDARERTVEWANVSWWAGFAEARGVELALPTRSRLGRHPFRYGMEYDEERRSTQRYVDLMLRLDTERAAASGVGG